MNVKHSLSERRDLLFNRLGRIGRRSHARWMYWSVYHPFNFGDWIGPFLFEKITGIESWHRYPNNLSRHTVFMSAGSILSGARGDCIVWGSGIRSRCAALQQPWKICAVRGPYSQERCLHFGIRCNDVFGDPGILLPRFYSPPRPPVTFRLGIIPHFRDLPNIRRTHSAQDDAQIIDVRYPIETVVDQIRSCQAVVSSSLHGLIVANAYGIQSGWVDFGGRIGGDGIKFLDYFASLGCFNPVRLDDAARLSTEELVSFAKDAPILSTAAAADRLMEVCPFARETE